MQKYGGIKRLANQIRSNLHFKRVQHGDLSLLKKQISEGVDINTQDEVKTAQFDSNLSNSMDGQLFILLLEQIMQKLCSTFLIMVQIP
jgi:hypothetical protein